MIAELTPKVAIETHGCKLNQADSEKLALEFMEAGFALVGTDQRVDIYIVNTCTVTHVADRKARRAIRAARKQNPSAIIVATGCYVDRDEEAILALPEIDIIANNSDKVTLVKEIIANQGDDFISCTVGTDQVPVNLSLRRTRANVKIQEGCNQVCSYCIVPKVRGRERSIPADQIVSNIKRLQSVGYREVVLTGTQLGSYGFDITDGPDKLYKLIEYILQNTSIERLRVSSIQPQEVNPDLLNLWQDPRLCPHMHIPLQSGSNRILKLMRRRYTRQDYLASICEVSAKFPEISITTDIIVGFPGETESEYLDTIDIVNTVDFAKLHVFPFSIRPGTTAAYMKDEIKHQLKSLRVKTLIKLGEQKSYRYKQRMLGSVRSVLWEEKKHGVWHGLTDNYIRVNLCSDRDLGNQISSVLLMEQSGGSVACSIKE